MSVSFDPAKRSLLRGHIAPRRSVVRPPWSADEAAFINLCTRCDHCADACPEKIIRAGDGGFPEVDFSAGECTFCRACAESCPTDALHLNDGAPWVLELCIDDHCITRKQVVCRSCAEQCEVEAIRFYPSLGRVAEPQVDLSACTGCGACVVVCPTHAISLTPLNDEA